MPSFDDLTKPGMPFNLKEQFDHKALADVVMTCKECGAPIEFRWDAWRNYELHAGSVCFHCHFWLEKVGWAGPTASSTELVVRANGTHYTIGAEPSPDSRQRYSSNLGHGGARFIIHFHDGREVVSHNLWCQGEIPEHFRARLPDNAVFSRTLRTKK